VYLQDDAAKDPTVRGTWRSLADLTPPRCVVNAWRNPLALGTSTTSVFAAGGYPNFFRARGVRRPEDVPAFADAAQGGSGETESTPPLPEGQRELRAADLVLSVPRPQIAQNTTTADPATGIVTITSYSLGNPEADRRGESAVRLDWRSLYRPPVEDGADMLSRLLGQAFERGLDEILIGTLWMVSPIGVDLDAMPDDTWIPYPQHAQHWNLLYATPRAPALPDAAPLTLNTGLAFEDLTKSLLAPVNDALSAASAAVLGLTYRGRFWTAP
jgi:hypothetical protein